MNWVPPWECICGTVFIFRANFIHTIDCDCIKFLELLLGFSTSIDHLFQNFIYFEATIVMSELEKFYEVVWIRKEQVTAEKYL